MPGELDHVIFPTSCTSYLTPVYNMEECRISRIAWFETVLLKIRLEMEDCDKNQAKGLFRTIIFDQN